MGEHHAEFDLFKDFESSPSTLSYYGCDTLTFDCPESLQLESPNDPLIFDCGLFVG